MSEATRDVTLRVRSQSRDRVCRLGYNGFMSGEREKKRFQFNLLTLLLSVGIAGPLVYVFNSLALEEITLLTLAALIGFVLGYTLAPSKPKENLQFTNSDLPGHAEELKPWPG